MVITKALLGKAVLMSPTSWNFSCGLLLEDLMAEWLVPPGTSPRFSPGNLCVDDELTSEAWWR